MHPALQGGRESPPDVAATRQYDPAYRLVELAQLSHHRAAVLLRGDEEHLVVGFDHGVALGNDPDAPTEYRRDPGLDRRHPGRELTQRMTDEGTAVVGLHAHELHPSLGEIQHLQRPGGLDEPVDVLGDELLGADDEIDGEGVPREELAVPEIGRGAHARDLGRRAEDRPGDLACDHVRLVAAGHREHEVGVFRPGAGQHVGVRRVPVDRPDVEVILK